MNGDALALVNPRHPLAEEGRPHLAAPDARFPRVLMERRAAARLRACIARVGGQGQIVPVSGFRSRAEQQAIWESTLAAEGEAFTRRYVALPGCSEHQTGLAIDLALAAEHIDFVRPHFPTQGVCGAFRRAAPRFGFILRYPPHKQAITSIAHEPWHFRYVGAPHALFMQERGLCLEEYLELVHAHPWGAPPLRLDTPAGAYQVGYLPGDAPAPPPEEGWHMQPDNCGGRVLIRRQERRRAV